MNKANKITMSIIILSVMLVVMFLALTAVYNYTPPQSDMDNYQAIFYTPQELEESPLAVYKNAYTQKSLTGYIREEVTENNFRYIIYKSYIKFYVLSIRYSKIK